MKGLVLAFTAAAAAIASPGLGFVPPTALLRPHQPSKIAKAATAKKTEMQMSATARKSTLDETTTWRLRFVLNGVPTAKGRKVDELFVVEAKFVEEEGYEPPQGILKQILLERDDGAKEEEGETAAAAASGRNLEITDSFWKLSEDPDERKDGLWVWGLFAEPLYPFMLLQLETRGVPLPGEDGDSVKPLKLYAQIKHRRDEDAGVILEASTLNVRELETVKADVFGVATVDVYDEVNVGQLSIQPIAES